MQCDSKEQQQDLFNIVSNAQFTGNYEAVEKAANSARGLLVSIQNATIVGEEAPGGDGTVTKRGAKGKATAKGKNPKL